MPRGGGHVDRGLPGHGVPARAHRRRGPWFVGVVIRPASRLRRRRGAGHRRVPERPHDRSTGPAGDSAPTGRGPGRTRRTRPRPSALPFPLGAFGLNDLRSQLGPTAQVDADLLLAVGRLPIDEQYLRRVVTTLTAIGSG